MGRPVKWSRDLHAIRGRAQRSHTETWSRKDVEALFGVGRATAQTLTRAIGEVRNVAGAHFIERASLLAFLDAMVTVPSVEEELRHRIAAADSRPAVKPLRIFLPTNARSVTFRDLPSTISLSPGRLVIEASTVAGIVEGLALIAQALQNDLNQFERLVEFTPPARTRVDDELKALVGTLRNNA